MIRFLDSKTRIKPAQMLAIVALLATPVRLIYGIGGLTWHRVIESVAVKYHFKLKFHFIPVSRLHSKFMDAVSIFHRKAFSETQSQVSFLQKIEDPVGPATSPIDSENQYYHRWAAIHAYLT